ncbi:MAG: hypothetical protein V1792_11915 [Pseudomonadota bacterium]
MKLRAPLSRQINIDVVILMTREAVPRECLDGSHDDGFPEPLFVRLESMTVSWRI